MTFLAKLLIFADSRVNCTFRSVRINDERLSYLTTFSNHRKPINRNLHHQSTLHKLSVLQVDQHVIQNVISEKQVVFLLSKRKKL